MDTPKGIGRLTQRVESWLGSLAVAMYRRPKRALLVIGVILVAALGVSTRLSLTSDLVELLPKSFPSVKDLEVVKKRFGGIGNVIICGLHGTPEAMRRFADDLAPQIEALPAIRYVEFRRPAAFFEDRLLYFLDLEDLKTVQERLAARYEWERQQRNPMFLDLEESEPPSMDFSDLGEKYAGRSDQQWVRNQVGEVYYLDTTDDLWEGGLIALLAKPAALSADMEFAQKAVRDVQGVIDRMDLSKYGAGFAAELTGRYTRRVDQQNLITRDLRIASVVALLLVLLYLGVHFRRFLAVALITVPLLIGLSWTFGFAALTLGSLNIISGFAGAILIGLGIDHGIHILGRYEAERAATEPEEAIRRTFGNTGRAVTVAALTTTVGFASLSISEFRAFSEFGILAAAGMALMVAAYVTCLPALLSLATRRAWSPRAKKGVAASPYAVRLPRWAGRLLLGCLVGLILSILYISDLRFNYDFRALEANHLISYRLDMVTNELLGYAQSPQVILTSTEEEERQVAAAVRARQARLGERSTIDFVLATTDLIPTQQSEKWEVIQELGRITRKVKPSWLDPEHRPRLRDLKRMAAIEPYTKDDLPMEVRRQFKGLLAEGSNEYGFVLVFPRIDVNVGSEISAFAREVRDIPLADGRRVSAAGEEMILADIFEMVTRETPPVLTVTLIAIVATLWLLLGSLRQTILCLAPALVTLAATFGLMSLTGLEFNYMNIVMVPVLFGIGVDGGAHIVTRLAAGQRLTEVVSETGRAISGAILTTGLGFGSLQIADHPGLVSLGRLAVLGLAVNALACLVGLPAFIAWRSRRRRGGGGTPISIQSGSTSSKSSRNAMARILSRIAKDSLPACRTNSRSRRRSSMAECIERVVRGEVVRLTSKPMRRFPRTTRRSSSAPACVAQKKHSSGRAPSRVITS